jgi:hypothetical protein
MNRLIVPGVLAGSLLLLSGCGGGGAETQTTVTTTTIGQQLTDLKKAYDSGAISEDEYNRLREKIIRGK